MDSMVATVTIPKKEYDALKRKAKRYEELSEELTPAELRQVRAALKGPMLSEAEFLRRNPDLR